MKPFTLIYDLFDGANFGLYEAETTDRVASIVVIQDDTGEHYEGQAFNVPRLASRFFESLDEFADRLYALYTSRRAERLRAQARETAELSLF